jgi:hypothetical protein
MSGGCNKIFMENPRQFMATNPIDIKGGSELDGASNGMDVGLTAFKGIHDFDLEQSPKGEFHLRLYSARTKGWSLFGNRIRAYWLPWKSKGAASIQLGDEADYFFTSALGGCRIQIGAGRRPLVTHIAGDLNKVEREAAAADAQWPSYEDSRRFSSTTEYNLSQLAFLVGKAFEKGDRRYWRFFAQGIAIVADETGAVPKTKMVVSKLTEHTNGVVEV